MMPFWLAMAGLGGYIVNNLLPPLMVEFVKERAPGLAIWLIKLSVRSLPTAHRCRYFEEWTAELEEMDRQNVSQLVASIRILLGARAVGRALRAKDRNRTVAEGLAAAGSGFDAYITYSHALDGELASALQIGLQRFAKPWYRLRALRIFRDTTSLSASPGLWSSMESALASSSWLVLMASPHAAQSQWVNREVAWWLEHKSPQRVLVVLTEGRFAFAEDVEDGERASAALPPALRGAFVEQPRWVDLRWLHDVAQVDQSNPRLGECVADIAAALREVPKDELVGEHIRQHVRTRRIARGGVTALTVLLLASLVAGIVAVGQRNQAIAQARITNALQLVMEAEAVRGINPRTALMLGIAAQAIDPSSETRSSLVNTLSAVSHNHAGTTTLTGHTGPVESVAFSPDGRTLASGGADKTAILWDLTDPSRPTRRGASPTDHPAVNEAAFSPDRRTLASGGADGLVQLWNVTDPSRPTRRGAPLTGHTGPVESVAFSPDGDTLASGGADGLVQLWDVTELNYLRDHATERACSITGRGLNRDEWALYISRLAYQNTCPS